MKCRFCDHEMKIVEEGVKYYGARIKRWDCVYYKCENCAAQGPKVFNMSLQDSVAGMSESKRLAYAKDLCGKLTLGVTVDVQVPTKEVCLRRVIRGESRAISILKSTWLPSAEKSVRIAKDELKKAQEPRKELHNFARYKLLSRAYESMAHACENLYRRRCELDTCRERMTNAQKELQMINENHKKENEAHGDVAASVQAPK